MATKRFSSDVRSNISRLAAKSRWRPEDARDLLDQHRGSGLSIAGFADQHGLDVKRLYWWRKRLKTVPARTAPASVRFLPVSVLPAAGSAGSLDVELRGGRRIRVTGEFEAGLLARLVLTLEALPC